MPCGRLSWLLVRFWAHVNIVVGWWWRKTHALYRAAFTAVRDLVPDFTREHVMADFEEACVGAFQEVFVAVTIAGCWFHCCQAVIKRLNKRGLIRTLPEPRRHQGYRSLHPWSATTACRRHPQCLRGDSCDSCTWLGRYSSCWRTFNVRGSTKERLIHGTWHQMAHVLENYHAALRRRIQVSRQNLFVFSGHLHRATVDYMSDRQRLANGPPIRRTRRKQQLKNDSRLHKCFKKYDNGVCSLSVLWDTASCTRSRYRRQRWWFWPWWQRGYRERHDFCHRVRRVRRRLFRHFWLLWSLPASNASWRGSGALRAFSILWQLRRHCERFMCSA